jgi:hypothetical protein
MILGGFMRDSFSCNIQSSILPYWSTPTFNKQPSWYETIESVYNRDVKSKSQSIPTDRLSIISALIILNYALMPFIYSPEIPIRFSILGFVLDLHVEYADLMVLSAASFAAIGTYWLLYDHPMLDKSHNLIHLILPTLVAGAMSIPLNVITIGLAWWVVFALESALIIFTLIAEYYSVDPENSLFALSKIILVPLAISLLLLLSVSSRSADYRLYLEIIILGVAFAIIFTRLIALTTIAEKNTKVLISTLLFIQILVACHYLPLKSISFGLILTGFASSLFSFPLTEDSEKNLLHTVRDSALYALPFLVSAIFFL